ncbi:MAG: endo-1,4-beta-xylanase [Phycisphaerales bacterium]
MIRFAVHGPADTITQATLAAAHVLGPDGTGIRGDVRTAPPNVIECRRAGEGAAALSLPFSAGTAGRLMLQTCLLPAREEPYSLTVELARYQVKSFLAKSEEWQMFDAAKATTALETWERARAAFTRAMVSGAGAEAEADANTALQLGIEANERLSLEHAKILLQRRFGTRAASSATLGAKVWPQRSGDALQDFIGSHFDLAVLPIRWAEIEPEEGKLNWAPLDRWMAWAKKTGKPVVAGPLVDFSGPALPVWMQTWQHDFETCRDFAYDFMEKVIQRYAGAVAMWNLASGINVNDNFRFTAPQMLDLVRTARLLVRQYRRGARTMIEIRHPFGDYVGRNRDSIAPLPFVTHLRQEGVQLDALGIQLVFGPGPHGEYARDLMQISNVLDRMHLLDLPLLVSGLGVPSGIAPDAPDRGWWHGPWSSRIQERWISRVFSLALSKPQVESIFWTDVYDHPGADVLGAGLLDGAGKPKDGLRKLVGMRRRLRKPLGSDASLEGGDGPGVSAGSPAEANE